MDQSYFSIVGGKSHVLCAHFEHTVDIYRLSSRATPVSSNTIFKFGGKRIDICEEKELFCCGDFYKGIAAYRLADGKELWMNKEIKQVQTVFLTDQYALVQTEKSKLHVLSLEDGRVTHTVDKVQEIYRTAAIDSYLLQQGRKIVLLTMKADGPMLEPVAWVKVDDSLHMLSKYLDKFFVYRAYKSLESFSTDGKLLWTSDLQKGYLVNAIFYSKEARELYCWTAYNANTHMENYIVRIDAASGKVIDKYLLKDTLDIAISADKESFFCTNGSIIDAATGQVKGHFGEQAPAAAETK